MNIASNSIGIVAPVGAVGTLGGAPLATSGFGALLAIGVATPAKAADQPDVPASVPVPVPALSSAPVLDLHAPVPAPAPAPDAALAAEPGTAPTLSPTPAPVPTVVAAVTTSGPATSQPPASMPPADALPVGATPEPAPDALSIASAPERPDAAKPVANTETPLPTPVAPEVAPQPLQIPQVTTAIAAAALPTAIEQPQVETEADADTEPTLAMDKPVAPLAQPLATIAPIIAMADPAKPIAAAADSPEIATTAANAPRPVAIAATEAPSGDAKGAADAATPNIASPNALPALRSQGFHQVYETLRAQPVAPEPVVAAQPGTIGREMGVEIARQVVAGRDEMTVRLDPPEMGRVDIRLSFDREGTVRGVIAADSQGALELLRRESGELARALADAGVRSDAQSFRFDSRARDFGQQQQRHEGRHAESGREGAPQPGNAVPEQPHYRALRASGRIDLMA